MSSQSEQNKINLLKKEKIEYDSMGQISNANYLAKKLKEAGLYKEGTSLYTIELVIPKLVTKMKVTK